MTVPVVRRFPEQFGSYPRNLPLVDCASQLIQLGGIIKMTSTSLIRTSNTGFRFRHCEGPLRELAVVDESGTYIGNPAGGSSKYSDAFA